MHGRDSGLRFADRESAMRMRALSAIAVLGGTFSFGDAGCMSSEKIAVRDAARPQADAVLSDAPSLLPQVPVASTSTTRSQSPDVMLAASSSNGVAVRIRATVNGIPIMEDELREALAPHLGELFQVPESQRASALVKLNERELDRLIERELVLEEAMAKIKDLNRPSVMDGLKKEASKEADKRVREVKVALKIQNDEELKAALATQGMTIAGLRRQSERSFMMMEYVRNLIYPTVQRISLQQMRDYYQQHPDEFRTEDGVQWQDLFIDASKHAGPAAARAHAEHVLARVRAGEDFAKLAQEFDDGDSKLRGGAGLGSKHGEILPAQADELVWSLKAGEAALLDLGFGFHLVRIVSRDYAGQRPFDVPCQSDIRKKLQGIIAEREYKKIVDDLKRKATITIF
jgi:parvulin-like peptidyl-prolyl isomerase